MIIFNLLNCIINIIGTSDNFIISIIKSRSIFITITYNNI